MSDKEQGVSPENLLTDEMTLALAGVLSKLVVTNAYLTKAVEAAYREGYDTGYNYGMASWGEKDDESWDESKAKALLDKGE